MSKLKMVTIKNKHSGFTRTLGEPEFNGMMDKADYELVLKKVEKPKAKAKKTTKKTTKKKK